MLRRIGLNMFPKRLKSVSVLRHVVLIVQTFLDEDAHQPEGQSRVRAWLNGDVPVRHSGSACAVGVDHYQLRTVAPCFLDEGPEVNVVAVDIRTPRDDVPRMVEVFRGGAQLFPVDRFQSIAAGSGTDGAIELRGAEPVKES